MVGTNMKAETLAMVEKRGEMEAEMNSIIARLCAPGAPGLTGNLLDAEGFPRADIDIPAIRSDRQQLSILRSNHEDITNKIEKNIQILHSGSVGMVLPQKRTAEVEESTHQRMSPVHRAEYSNPAIHTLSLEHSNLGEGSHPAIPFAVFDEIQEGSPAALDGLMFGDQLLKFGSVEGGDHLLPRLASEGQMNEGNAVPVIVMRQGIQVHLTVTPRRWSGSGFLGCHIQPL